MNKLFLILAILLIIILFLNKSYEESEYFNTNINFSMGGSICDLETTYHSQKLNLVPMYIYPAVIYNKIRLPLRLEKEMTSWLDGKTVWEYHPDPFVFKATAVSPDLPDEDIMSDMENRCTQIIGNVKEKIMKYFEFYQEKYQCKPVVYLKAIHKWGRGKPKDWLSIATMSRNVRSTIWSDYYTDFDMENAHPVILSQILKGNYECPILNHYVNNRDTILVDLIKKYKIDKETAKKYIFSVLFGRTYYPIKDTMLNNFIVERNGNDVVKGWANVLKEANPHIYETAMVRNITEKNEHRPFKHLNTMIGWILQEYEYRLFCAVFEWCEMEGLLTAPDVPQLSGKLVFSYIYDGGCILTSAIDAWMKRTGKSLQDLLAQFSEVGFAKTGIMVRWTVKEWCNKIDINECYLKLKKHLNF
jgi:hypothetical protein